LLPSGDVRSAFDIGRRSTPGDRNAAAVARRYAIRPTIRDGRNGVAVTPVRQVETRHKRGCKSQFLAALLSAASAGLCMTAAHAATPLNYLVGYGTKAYPVVGLTWGLLIISIVVSLIFLILVPLGIWRRHYPRGTLALEAVPIERRGSGLKWLAIGLALSSVALVGSLVWTMTVLADVNSPHGPAALTIEVTGQQWWWKARYLNSDPSKILTTANEIHIPVGEPVRVRLIGADVIHSFWVPALTGKTDTIPGQINETWLEAGKPGRYRGQCTQYCGWQHAHMAFFVTAESPNKFQAWLSHQLEEAPPATSPEAQKGEHLFEAHCGLCHAVRGTMAAGTMAPDLTHLMSRETLAAGTLPNTPGDLAGWIANPQSIKPGVNMPNLYLSGPELNAITSYLETLK
jgi:cytochrome c oxidase subunit II